MNERLNEGWKLYPWLKSLSKVSASPPHGFGGVFIGHVVPWTRGSSERSTDLDAGLAWTRGWLGREAGLDARLAWTRWSWVVRVVGAAVEMTRHCLFDAGVVELLDAGVVELLDARVNCFPWDSRLSFLQRNPRPSFYEARVWACLKVASPSLFEGYVFLVWWRLRPYLLMRIASVFWRLGIWKFCLWLCTSLLAILKSVSSQGTVVFDLGFCL